MTSMGLRLIALSSAACTTTFNSPINSKQVQRSPVVSKLTGIAKEGLFSSGVK
jgi:hypothetical protein